MKNLKKTLAAVSLAAILGIGAVSANAGSVKGTDTTNKTNVQCTVKSGGFFQNLAGVINNLTGITIFDVTKPACTEVSLERARWS
ncbi:hypothetical protein BH20ACI1_BH20ACI1_26740 [soil metagenome]